MILECKIHLSKLIPLMHKCGGNVVKMQMNVNETCTVYSKFWMKEPLNWFFIYWLLEQHTWIDLFMFIASGSAAQKCNEKLANILDNVLWVRIAGGKCSENPCLLIALTLRLACLIENKVKWIDPSSVLASGYAVKMWWNGVTLLVQWLIPRGWYHVLSHPKHHGILCQTLIMHESKSILQYNVNVIIYVPRSSSHLQ